MLICKALMCVENCIINLTHAHSRKFGKCQNTEKQFSLNVSDNSQHHQRQLLEF